MRRTVEITNDYNQTLTPTLEDNTTFTLNLYFKPQLQGWYYDITYNSFSVSNCRLVTSPNILRQYKNVIPFGISVTTADFTEPIFLNDFVNGRVVIEILNATDVQTVENTIFVAS